MGLSKRFAELIKGNTGAELRTAEAPQRFPFFATTCIAGFLVMTGFGLFNLTQGHSLAAIWGLATAAVAAAAFLAALHAKHREPIYFAGLLMVLVFFLYLLQSGGEQGSLALWLCLIPILSFFLLGKRLGLAMIAISWIGILAWILDLQLQIPGDAYVYGAAFKIRFAITYGLLGVFSFVFEAVRVRLAEEASGRERKLQDLNSHIARLSITDKLTGCYNRLHFDERFPGEVKKATRYKVPLSLVICDIDHFKRINDTYGHDVGDRVLAAIGATLRSAVRADIDLVARCGGEEFAIVVPNTGTTGAATLSERIRAAVEDLQIYVEEQRVAVTASFGVSTVELTEDTSAALFKRADRRLYEAKEGGRNRVCAGKE